MIEFPQFLVVCKDSTIPWELKTLNVYLAQWVGLLALWLQEHTTKSYPVRAFHEAEEADPMMQYATPKKARFNHDVRSCYIWYIYDTFT